MKSVNISKTKCGIEIGDFILYKPKGIYGIITKIKNNIVDDAPNREYYRKYYNKKAGDVVSTHITINRLLNKDLTEVDKKYSIKIYDLNEIQKIDRKFIKSLFKILNDKLAYCNMLKDRKLKNE